MLSHGLITKGQLVLDAVIDSAGDTDSSSLGQPFHTGRDIDSIPVDPFSLLDDISKVYAYTKFHSVVFRQLSVSNPEFLLYLHSAPHRIHHT
jgi:hypothetical protein